MIETKLNLVILLQGRTMMSELECSETKNYKSFQTDFIEKYNAKKHPIYKRKTVYYRGTKPAYQKINISEDAYASFIDNKKKPKNFKSKPKPWHKLSVKERLLWNLHDLCNSLGGKLVSYTLYD